MIYQVGKKQCSISGRKQNDIAPLESDFMVQPPSLLEFPGPLTPPPPWNFQFPPWWGSGYFLELHIGQVNPFAPGDFAEKRVLKLVEWFSGHCRAIKS